jgi:hypothetical protein
MLYSLRLRLQWPSWPCEPDHVAGLSGKVAIETHETVSPRCGVRSSYGSTDRRPHRRHTRQRCSRGLATGRDDEFSCRWPASRSGRRSHTHASQSRWEENAPRYRRMSRCDRKSGTRESYRHTDPLEAPTASCAPTRSTSRRSPHRSAPARLRRLTDPGKDPAMTDRGGASPYHPRITQPSPTGQTLSDQKAPTCNFMPAVDWHRRPWTVSTTCAMWYRGTVRGSEPERPPARRSGIAGCSVVSRSPVRPSHVVRNLRGRGKIRRPPPARNTPSGTADP